jgi:hypothetical protein
MSQKILIEFFPEVVLHSVESSQNNSRQKVMVYQSKDSLRMLTFTRYIKRKFTISASYTIAGTKGTNIILIKRYTHLKGYRYGKKVRVRTIPALVLNGKLLWEGEVLPKRELEIIVKEILILGTGERSYSGE